MMMPVDTAWFDDDPETWLQREEFVCYQELARVDFRDLKSSCPETLACAQKRISECSVIMHEVRKEHAGFGVPLIAYTHDLNFGDQLEGHIEELDHLMMAEDIFDSLRRRHVALSYALLPALVEKLAEKARAWLRRRSLKLALDRKHSPSTWIRVILEGAKGRSGGVVEQHLVGAKLEKRFAGIPIPNYPAHAADAQTERPGDFAVQNIVYHVTSTPGRSVIQKCAANLKQGQHPILLVPQDQEYRASALADDEGVGEQISIISIENFLALNIIELSTGEGVEFFHVLQDIVAIYNRRLQEVETDLSLQIDV